MLGAILAIALVGGVAGRSVLEDGPCLARDGGMYTLISTMTPYDRVRGNIPEFQDCKAEGIWSFIRHGSRYPHDYEATRYSNLKVMRDEILENHRQSRGALCEADLAALRDWELVMDFNQSMLLSTSGFEELRRFGERMGDNFPHLLRNYTREKVEIRITSLERTRQSAEAFLTGLYKSTMKIPNSMIYDKLLKNERNCKEWYRSTHRLQLQEQKDLVRRSPEMQDLLSAVARRMGFEKPLTFEMAKDIYDTCSFEYAWYHSEKHSPWCAVFLEEHLKLLEFNEDLVYFYKSAYGNKYTARLGCFLVKDMLDRLSKLKPGSTFYYGHSSGVRKLLTVLGIGEDIMLSGDSYRNSADRKWRTSYLTPFAASVTAVRYECKKASHGIGERSRLAFFVNENLQRLPACGDREMCGLEEFRKKFASVISPDFCNKDFCEH